MGDKIAIIGNAGGGKSILAKKLCNSTGIPVFQLDKLQWNPGWVPTPADKFNQLHDSILAQTKWIVDGLASWPSIEKRLLAATTIIMVDFPLWIHLWWATKRQFWCIFRHRPDFVERCPMLPMTWILYKMMFSIHRDMRPRLLDLLNQYGSEKEVIRIRSPRQLNQFVNCYCRN